MKKRDDEKAHWLIIGILFSAALLAVDFWYSSFSQMAGIVKVLIILAHCGLGLLWVGAMAKFNDPNFDGLRKVIVWLSVILILIVGIHHATVREDQQVIEDSRAGSLNAQP